MHFIKSWIGLLALAALSLTATAQEKRVALVIANSDYRESSVSDLPNTVRDAVKIAETMKKTNFTVFGDKPQINLTKDQMAKTLVEFRKQVAGADWAVVYYAGHGVEIKGVNYLVPIDAKLESEDDANLVALDLNDVVNTVRQARAIKLVILDACRDNPFKVAKPGQGTRSIGTTRGLAAVSNSGDTLIMFAAGAGERAAEGDANGNSPFAQALSEYILKPGLEVRFLAGEVRDRVRQLNAAANRKIAQEPSVYGTIGSGRFFFVPPGQRVVGPDPAKGKKPGESFRDCPECPEMVIVPAGKFMMGSPVTEKGRRDNEGPQHEVTIAKPFAVGRFEVTFAEWDACLKEGGCKERVQKDIWGRGKQPLLYVSWDDAQEYLDWITKFSGRRYRLLSEAEWEYAARAGTKTAYAWGAEIGKGNANCGDCGVQWEKYAYTVPVGPNTILSRTIPVGSFQPNKFGLFDMHGNVEEWVEDCWIAGYEGSPLDGSARTYSASCGTRVSRGGSWMSLPSALRSAARSDSIAGVRSITWGFRVARDIPN